MLDLSEALVKMLQVNSAKRAGATQYSGTQLVDVNIP